MTVWIILSMILGIISWRLGWVKAGIVSLVVGITITLLASKIAHSVADYDDKGEAALSMIPLIIFSPLFFIIGVVIMKKNKKSKNNIE